MTALMRYDAACRALAEAKTFDEVKDLHSKSQAIQAYAKQAKNKTLEIDAAEIRMRAERRLGEMLAQTPKNKGQILRGEKMEPREEIPTLAEIGIDKKLSGRAQKIAAVPEEKFESMVSEWRDRVAVENERVTANLLTYKHVSDDSYEWYTPPEYIEAARTVMGSIDLDPASCDEAQQQVKATKYYTKEINGLTQPWFGNVWLNPPYCMPEVHQFTEKSIISFECGNIQQAIILVNNATDTTWFQGLLSRGCVCFTSGRIHFYSPGGEQKLQTRQGQSIFYLGSNQPLFVKEFSQFGTVMVRAS